MKRVYLVRHGESVANAKMQRQFPHTPLSDIGLSQAKMLAHRFGKIQVDEIVCSDYLRTKQTAEPIVAATNKPISYSPLFRERKFPSETRGMRYEDPFVVSISEKVYYHRNDPDWRYSDEENYFEYYERGKQAVSCLENLKSKSVCVVTHGAIMRMMIWSMWHGDSKLDVDGFLSFDGFFKSRNTGITVCEYNGRGWILVVYNDHAHLG